MALSLIKASKIQSKGSQRIKETTYMRFVKLITLSNNKRNEKVKPLSDADKGRLIDMHAADNTLPVQSGLQIGEVPKQEKNLPRSVGFKILNYYTSSRYAPASVKTPVGKITEEIMRLWSVYVDVLPNPVFPVKGKDQKASDILTSCLQRKPFHDYVKVAISNRDAAKQKHVVIDLSYLSKFETQNSQKLGARIYLKNVVYKVHDDNTMDVHDWQLEKIETDRFGSDKECTEKSFAVACRALSVDVTWSKHLILCHLHFSSLVTSDVISCLPPTSRYRRLLAPYFNDSRSLLFDEVAYLTKSPDGEIMKTSGLTQKGMLDLFLHCRATFDLDHEYKEALLLHKEYMDIFEEFVHNLVGDCNDLNLELPHFKTTLTSQQVIVLLIYMVTTKHKVFGTSILTVLPYLPLSVDETSGEVYREDLLYSLTTAYGTFYNFKAMLQDDFLYLCTTTKERLAYLKFRKRIFEFDAIQRERDPNDLLESYAMELDSSCMR